MDIYNCTHSASVMIIYFTSWLLEITDSCIVIDYIIYMYMWVLLSHHVHVFKTWRLFLLVLMLHVVTVRYMYLDVQLYMYLYVHLYMYLYVILSC